jgi:hypothetical protein
MLRGDPKRTEPLNVEFIIERWADAIKLVGAGNSAGLFGAGVALYYFGNKPYLVLLLIKIAIGIYFLGVLSFALSFFCLTAYMHGVDFALQGERNQWEKFIDLYYKTTAATALFSTLLWLLGSSVLLSILYYL